MEVFDIVIISFGASGVSLLNEMQNEGFTKRYLKPNIAIFNNQKSFAKGKAFGGASPIHIVNTSLELMTPSVAEPNEFWHWLREQNAPKHLTWNALLRESHLSPLKAFMKLLLKEHRSLQNESKFKTVIRLLPTGKQAEYSRYLESRAANTDLSWQDILVSTRYRFHEFCKVMRIQEKYQFVSRFGSLCSEKWAYQWVKRAEAWATEHKVVV
ncbi:FAD/NAD(P)-binding protein [Vibrio caribbeanicus]|uniref:FAD-dependent urate hydroxylase HpyO/Asp monooxygenase CreE-like FAD/NAD(P)-binding domain-containing protein n=1 Tax=Vibrio caribbeanicus ATCC BAA-2122 TaxID=796620 RepID=E3BNX2_9VIBR|nr:FAD/NAD(P)-binding protein [Vibrio caribbeanicus]EFP95279.1 hypothetical protein VIBC2010_15732 [Vibrio caribbeanicus ATCC BAA-2122]